jgi:hypothetical protein
VATHGEGAEALVRGFDDPPLALDSLPVVASARVGRGRIFLFGDTYFAANKNLELEDGTTPTVVRENAHFWRWFFAELNGPKWVPPEPPPKGGESDDDAGDDAPGQSGKAAADPRAASPKRSTSKEATP